MVSAKRSASGIACIVKNIAAGTGLSMAVTLAGAALGAGLLAGQILTQEGMEGASFAIEALAAFAGGLLASARIGHHKMQMSFLTAGCYYLALLLVTMLFFAGDFSGMGRGALAAILGSSAVAILSVLGKKRPRFKSRKRVYR